MKINDAGLSLIKRFEGLELVGYPDPAPGNKGLPITIGYGSTRIFGRLVKLGEKITLAQAEAQLKLDVQVFENGVMRLVKVPLTPNQFSALVSFAYNVGLGNLQSSTLLKLLNAKQYHLVPAQFLRWNKAAGKVMKGLVNRRQAEAQLFSAK